MPAPSETSCSELKMALNLVGLTKAGVASVSCLSMLSESPLRRNGHSDT